MVSSVRQTQLESSGQDGLSLTLADGRTWNLDPRRPRVMGIVNVTPDSFSDGGLWLQPEAAVDHALQLVEEGADLIDLGAESSRPGGGIYGQGAETVSADEELKRLLPVLDSLRAQTDRLISVDTRKPGVARRAVEAGADLVNDIGGLQDPAMIEVAAAARCPVVVMHSRGETASMQRNIRYDDLLGEVVGELGAAVERAQDGGVTQVVVDPGIGFGKTFSQNLELVVSLDQIAALGYPVLLGTSRKGYLGELTGRSPCDRVAAGLATLARAMGSVHVVRVHDVAATVDFLAVWAAHDQPNEAFSGQYFPEDSGA